MKQEFVQEGARKYLKIFGGNLENMGDKMFSYRTIPGFVPMEIEWVDEKKQYVYDVTGMIRLSEYLKREDTGRQKVKHIMECILSLPKKIEEYLLDGNGVRIEPDCVFIEPHSEEICGVYYPENDLYGLPAYASIAEYIMEYMNQKDSELAFFVYGLHKRLKEPGTTLESLYEYMNTEIQVKQKEEKIEVEVLGASPKDRWMPVLQKENFEKFRYAIPLGIMAIGVLIPFILYISGWFDLAVSGSTDWVKVAGATVFFVGVALYGAWKLWPNKEEGITWEETSSLSVCLISCQGKEEPVPLTHFPFSIGSESGRVDGVLHARGISKIHARFILEGDVVFLQDEESANGTFYNDTRLVPWQKTRVEDGDLLRFGDGEYVVEIT